MRLLAVGAILAAGVAARALGQLGEGNHLGVRVGHVHLLVRDVAAHRRFFTELLGGRVVERGALELIEFPGLYVALSEADEPLHPSGTRVDHFGFMVRDFAAHRAAWQAAGVAIEPLENPNEVYVLTPDRVRVEVYGEPATPEGIYATHVHYYVPDVAAIRSWYVETFGANPSRRPCIACLSQPRMNPTVDVGALNLTMAPETTVRAPTRGSSIDHIGFEVENLEAFVRRLEARGVALEAPVRTLPGTNVKSAFLVDPWGTRIELTEGLAVP
jgi:catechol 2,3-dioxygenase-like lactoylglutathione lyase family enzyme